MRSVTDGSRSSLLTSAAYRSRASRAAAIEALESFRRGWIRTDKKSRSTKAFCLFFDNSGLFRELRGHGADFHKHVRCGILHHADTTGGWRIRRDISPLFDPTDRTINARLFLDALNVAVNDFCDRLKIAAWDSAEWKNVRHKMDAMVRHCAMPTKAETTAEN